MPIRPEFNHETQRYKRLSRLQAYFDGTQYKGRPDFFTGIGPGSNGKPVPLRERAPCVIYPLPKAAVNQATRFTFGESRFPTIKVTAVESGDAIAPTLALSEDDAEALTKGISALVEQACLRAGMRTLERRGLSSCTAVAVLAVRDGKFTVDMPHAKDCIPTFREGTSEVVEMTICYQFDKLVPEPRTGMPQYQRHYYRRDITATDWISYEDAPVKAPGVPIDWIEASRRPHGLGFCPVVWIRNLPESYDADPDGCSLYEGLEDELDALNFALSQRHRGITYFGTPQGYETGVEEDDGPEATGRVAGSVVPMQDESGALTGFRRPAEDETPARKMAPNEWWRYRKDTARLGLIETSGKAFEVASAHVLDIRSRILEAIDVVLVDASTIAGKGDISAKLMTYLYAPLLGLVDELRECWWTSGLAAILGMMLRMVAALGGKGIYLPGAPKLATILGRFLVQDADDVTGAAVTRWLPPTMTPTWGEYFSPSNTEIKLAVDTALEAAGTLVSKETATRYVAPYFGVSDITAEAEEVDAESLEAAEQALEMAQAAKPPPPGGKPGPTKTKTKADGPG